ncbi:OmpH family outer membrane protein [Commensalibacter sp. M0391]|nr:OmpH family outer membrane protein [Commensalibacter melissae]MBI0016510.1 OmpH family outer membrane protein [Commensalibacter sp. B14384M2]MBI0018257.1 OmpH family outer membrane protein [Commensalibacter sp. W8133]MBI0049695.1 OmpH family outer membrane protein [Commensalibacter sp. B14384M3]MBI0179742.1 OmpH family outer membrane protein [Commensalibacter sp. W8163]
MIIPSFSGFNNSVHAADENNGWFIPKGSQTKPVINTSKTVKHSTANVSKAVPVASVPDTDDSDETDMQNQNQPVLPLPPIPTPAPIAKSNPPPQAVIGVISVPDVMRQSTAYLEASKLLEARRDNLQQDVQKEQKVWRSEQQQIQAKARTMTSEQIQSRARQLQARVLKAQKDFRNRSRIIQEAAQVSFGQIERELIQIIQNVASSHNMNLVLHREQVALSVNELDITNDVLKELNKNLPSVFVPAANVDPEELAKSGTMPTTANPEPQKSQTKAVEPKKTTK